METIELRCRNVNMEIFIPFYERDEEGLSYFILSDQLRPSCVPAECCVPGVTVLSHCANLAATTAGAFSEAILAQKAEKADRRCMWSIRAMDFSKSESTTRSAHCTKQSSVSVDRVVEAFKVMGTDGTCRLCG